METVAHVGTDPAARSLSSDRPIVHVPFGGGLVVPSAHQPLLPSAPHLPSFQVPGLVSRADLENRHRSEIARRPSYRKILNDINDEAGSRGMAVTKLEEESNSAVESDDDDLDQGTVGGGSVLSGSGLPVAGQSDASGLQTLTMTNSAGPAVSTSPSAPTIVQYTQGPDGQFFIPVTALSTGTVQAYQLTSQSSLPQGVVMASSGNTLGGSPIGEDGTRKRELRLLKNREAARECRRKKKEYVRCLENRVAVLEQQNKTLIEELKSLKELYCQKDG